MRNEIKRYWRYIRANYVEARANLSQWWRWFIYFWADELRPIWEAILRARARLRFRREVQWKPGFDYRKDPEKKKFGCHGMEMRWLLVGRRATVQFLVMTPWLPGLRGRMFNFGPTDDRSMIHQAQFTTELDVLPADLGYHADAPQHDGQKLREDCDTRPSGGCFYDGSGMNAARLFELFLTEGDEAVWRYMEGYYDSLFRKTK